jgi:hypothetical protein
MENKDKQLEFNLDVKVIKKKTRAQKEEDKRHEYFERVFHGNLQQISNVLNRPAPLAENIEKQNGFDS